MRRDRTAPADASLGGGLPVRFTLRFAATAAFGFGGDAAVPLTRVLAASFVVAFVGARFGFAGSVGARLLAPLPPASTEAAVALAFAVPGSGAVVVRGILARATAPVVFATVFGGAFAPAFVVACVAGFTPTLGAVVFVPAVSGSAAVAVLFGAAVTRVVAPVAFVAAFGVLVAAFGVAFAPAFVVADVTDFAAAVLDPAAVKAWGFGSSVCALGLA